MSTFLKKILSNFLHFYLDAYVIFDAPIRIDQNILLRRLNSF